MELSNDVLKICFLKIAAISEIIKIGQTLWITLTTLYGLVVDKIRTDFDVREPLGDMCVFRREMFNVVLKKSE
jgi:hypothetical protein